MDRNTQVVWAEDGVRLTTPMRSVLASGGKPLLYPLLMLTGSFLVIGRLEYLSIKWAFLDPEPSVDPLYPFVVGFVLLILAAALLFFVQLTFRGQVLITADAAGLRMERRIGRWDFVRQSLAWAKLSEPNLSADADGATNRVTIVGPAPQPVILAVGLDADTAERVAESVRGWKRHA